jgi:NADH-quinone oxidoreductase subunit E
MLRMPLIRVLEVATFYTQFQLKPVGTRAHVQVCGTTPCMLRGSDELKAVCKSKIHAEPFHLNEGGTLSWEEVECLGACVNAPMVAIFQDTYEDLTPERLGEIIDAFEAGRGAEVKPGPQNGRHLSVPIGGLTSLFGEEDAASADQPSRETTPRSAPTGGEASVPPAQAARPDTHAAETDPTIAGPGKAKPEDSAPASAEPTTSDRLVAEASRPGSGSEGGSFEGKTGAEEKDAAEFGTTPSDKAPGDARDEGKLRDQEAAASDAVVAERKLVDNPEGTATEPARRDVNDTAGGDPFAPVVEGKRKDTSDTSGGDPAKD